jgi:hypothetical protein
MTAVVRALPAQFECVKQTRFKNLLANGCSYTWNNHTTVPVTWPCYLRDLMGFDRVLDCSQPGGGNTHIFNSTLNELELATGISAADTLVVVMWSGLERTDMLADHSVTSYYDDCPRPTYRFDQQQQYSSTSIWDNLKNGSPLAEFNQLYNQLFLGGARITQSLLHIIALANYLQNRGYQYVFLSWEPLKGLELADPSLVDRAVPHITDITTLGSYATATQQRIPNDGHPTVDAHLQWTRQVLVPYLTDLIS